MMDQSQKAAESLGADHRPGLTTITGGAHVAADQVSTTPSRRSMLRGLALAPVAVTAGAAAGSLLAAELPDPIFAAIERHKAARDYANTIDSEQPEWEPAIDAEHLLWCALTDQAPATLPGLVAFVNYVLAYPDIGLLAGDEGAGRALISVAKTLNSMGSGT